MRKVICEVLTDKAISPSSPPSWTTSARLWCVLTHPVHFMRNGGFHGDPWLPLLLVAIILAAVELMLLPDLRKTYSDPEFVKQHAERKGLTESQSADEVAKMSRAAPYLAIIEAPIVVTAGAAGVAAVLWVVSRIHYRRKVAYLLLFSMVSWASFVSAAPLLLNFAVRAIKSDASLATSAAVLLPASLKGGYIYNVLLALDPFLLWQVWLLGLGMAALCEVSRQRAITSVGTIFVLLAVLNAVGLTAAGN